MKEFIEKLIGRLEEIPVGICGECPNILKCNEIEDSGMGKNVDLCGATIKQLAIEIVNQLAEEYNNGWIPCSEKLPEDGQKVLVYREDGHCSGMSVARFKRGKTKEELESMECMCVRFADQWGNNLKPYAWDGDGPMMWNGQDIIAWQPLPAPYKEEGE